MNRWFWRIVVLLTSAGIITVVVMLALPKPPISGPIKSQLTSTLMLPDTGHFPVDRASTKYDPKLKELSYNASAFGQTIIVSEQPTPDQFTDVPQVYQKVLESMADYADFDVSVGSVHLTQPAQLNGLQTAVLNSKGTLLFAKPASNLTEDQWRQFFTSFRAAQ